MARKPEKQPTFAKYVEKDISPVTALFVTWLEQETGYPVDDRTASLVLDLHGRFQKSPLNQKRIAEAAARRQAEVTARAERKAARETTPAEKAATPKPKKAPARRTAAKAGE